MSLIYSSGPYRNDFYAGTLNRQALLTNINSSLTAAGWTSQNAYAFSVGNWTGQPTAAQTVTLGGQVYTFRAAVGATANEVLIGADASSTFQNLVNAVNLGSGSGTTYGSATTLNATVTAADYTATTTAIGYFRAQTKINSSPFGQQNTISFSTTTSVLIFTYAQNQCAGYIWTCPPTPLGNQQIRIYGIDELIDVFGQLYITLTVMDESEKYKSNPWSRYTAFGALNTDGFRLNCNTYNWRVIAGRYSVAVLPDALGPDGSGRVFYAGVPYIFTEQRPYVISGATNTSPVTITTGSAHGLTSGDTQFIRGETGNTAINGSNIATVLTATTYTIPVVGNGVYANNGVMSPMSGSSRKKCAMVIYAAGDRVGSSFFPYTRLNAEDGRIYQNLNGVFYSTSNTIQTGSASLIVPGLGKSSNQNSALVNVDGTGTISEPHFCISGTTTDKAVWAGQLYDMFVSTTTSTIGNTAVVDTYNWFCIGSSALGGTNLTTGSVWLRVP